MLNVLQLALLNALKGKYFNVPPLGVLLIMMGGAEGCTFMHVVIK
jgi:hypothetical protein